MKKLLALLLIISTPVWAADTLPRTRTLPSLGWSVDQVVDLTSAGTVTGVEVAATDLDCTLFANGKPRIVSIHGVEIEAELSEYMLYITNEDKPGFIGALGTALGASGVNIGTFNLGRDKENKTAIALVSVDEAITPEVVKKVSKLENVRTVKALRF